MHKNLTMVTFDKHMMKTSFYDLLLNVLKYIESYHYENSNHFAHHALLLVPSKSSLM